MKYKQVKCKYCSNKFTRLLKRVKWNAKNGWNTYCSIKCKDMDNVTSEYVNCETCQTKTLKRQSQIKKSKSGKMFCSRHCAIIFNNKVYKSGYKHPNYKGGNASYRSLAFKLKKPACSICGYSNKKILQVHHIDWDRNNNLIENLEILCPTHHSEKHILKK